jgi:uncharacterized protein (DUF433 family)
MRTPTEYRHVETDEAGRLFVRGTQYKVLVLLRDHTAWGLDAAQMQRQHDGLTLGQAHGLLEYYYDHKAEIDALMAEEDRRDDELRASLPTPPVVERLRKLKRELEAERTRAFEQERERGIA